MKEICERKHRQIEREKKGPEVNQRSRTPLSVPPITNGHSPWFASAHQAGRNTVMPMAEGYCIPVRIQGNR